MRVPPPPNTSININFPMYMTPPSYHPYGGYSANHQQQQQRYPPPPSSNQPPYLTNSQNPYIAPSIAPSTYGVGVGNNSSSLPPYA